jgi:hypothetical protein
MSINTATATNGNLGVILRVKDASFTHYAFIYYVADNTVYIQKVDAAGGILLFAGYLFYSASYP